MGQSEGNSGWQANEEKDFADTLGTASITRDKRVVLRNFENCMKKGVLTVVTILCFSFTFRQKWKKSFLMFQ